MILSTMSEVSCELKKLSTSLLQSFQLNMHDVIIGGNDKKC